MASYLQPTTQGRERRSDRRNRNRMDPQLLLALMAQFDPQRQQAEQLMLQERQQGLQLRQDEASRAAQQFAMAQERASQFDPLQEQLLAAQVAAAQGQNQLLPQTLAGGETELAAKQFALQQSQELAPIARQQAAAQLAATQAGPGNATRALDLEQRQLEQVAAHQAALQQSQEEQNQVMRTEAVLRAMQTGGVPGMQPNPEAMATATGGMLRPAGTMTGFNQLLGQGQPAEALSYLDTNPQLREGLDPQLLTQLAMQATGGQMPGAGGSGLPQPEIAPAPWWSGLTMGMEPGYRLIDYLGRLRGQSEAERQTKMR